jgi:hypothetical protein
MISICIPVYNFDITPLVKELAKQIGLLNQSAEIVIIDDCSDRKYKELNRIACQEHIYVELAENIGRARIRNLFLKYVKYDYLLFLDCDSLILLPTFLSNYLEIIRQKPAIVCGGRIHEDIKPSREKRLRWKYGNSREIRSVEVRNRFPNNSFMTNNFLIDRKILEQIKFDKRITQYGHEDTLFGYSLKKNDIVIRHIDNPVENGDFDYNKDYLKKTEEGIKNLVGILNFPEYQEDLQNDVALLRFYRKVKKFDGVIGFLFTLHKRPIRWLLSKGYVSLCVFDFYKLGILIENIKKQQETKH